jgi:DNA-binding NarL/FixJ family response regulator
MPNGTLVVSRANKLYCEIKTILEELDFPDVKTTGEEKDSLNAVINELKPRFVLVASSFYQAATPFRMGQLLKNFPKLNIAAISVQEYPVSLAAWFIWHGVKSYVNLFEGLPEFILGLREVREGKVYISPNVRRLIDLFPEWPKTRDKATKRLLEILVLMCNGFEAESIGEELGITRNTIYSHLDRLYNTFNVHCREEMVALAWELELVTEKDMRFFDRRKKLEPLPEWAAVKQRLNRRVLQDDCQN